VDGEDEECDFAANSGCSCSSSYSGTGGRPVAMLGLLLVAPIAFRRRRRSL